MYIHKNCEGLQPTSILLPHTMLSTYSAGVAVSSHFPPPPSLSHVFPSNLAFFPGDEGRSSFRSYKAGIILKFSSFRHISCSSSGNSLPAGENLSSFCIIEGPDTVEDFVQMQLQELDDNIRSRRNKIFLLMEEVRRLRIQQRIRSVKSNNERIDENEMPEMQSTIPFLPNTTPKTMKQLYSTSFCMVSGIILFGGLLAPVLELKLGLGGTSYKDFIQNMHLPLQLSQVDPIIASFSGGAVGVISALMLIEANNVEQQQKKRCNYCQGTGYLACARCCASGICVNTEPAFVAGIRDDLFQTPTTHRCPNCYGAGKVMCPTCLCTGMVMASEHDPRIDPFD